MFRFLRKSNVIKQFKILKNVCASIKKIKTDQTNTCYSTPLVATVSALWRVCMNQLLNGLAHWLAPVRHADV